MPDKDGFPYAHEIASGFTKKEEDTNLIKLSGDQQKAMILILSGAPFVVISMAPKLNDEKIATGCDFFTAMDGDTEVLRDAKSHISGVIDRLFTKRGII